MHGNKIIEDYLNVFSRETYTHDKSYNCSLSQEKQGFCYTGPFEFHLNSKTHFDRLGWIRLSFRRKIILFCFQLIKIRKHITIFLHAAEKWLKMFIQLFFILFFTTRNLLTLCRSDQNVWSSTKYVSMINNEFVIMK